LQDLAVLVQPPPIQCEATAEELIKAGYMWAINKYRLTPYAYF
jgi:hypothetical protein